MPISLEPKRVILPWQNGSLVEQAAKYLMDNHRCSYALGDVAGLDTVVSHPPLFVVVPGARAARILRSSMVSLAEERGVALYPPTVLTPGSLFNELFPKIVDAAPSKLTRRLAWAAALAANKNLLADDFTLLSSDTVTIGDRLKLADRLESLASELGAVAISFADVIEELIESGREREAQRWGRLQMLSEFHKNLLTSSGYIDVHDERIRLSQQGRTTGEKVRVVLVGVPDMPAYICKLLEHSSDIDSEVLIFTDPPWDSMFDNWGRPLTERWKSATVPLNNSQIHPCESLHHEAEVMAVLTHNEAVRCQQRLVIGAVGFAQQSAMKEALSLVGIAGHISEGLPGAGLPPVRAFKDFLALLVSKSWLAFSNSIRNPYLMTVVLREHTKEAVPPLIAKALQQADDWHTAVLPRYAPEVGDVPETYAQLRVVVESFEALLDPWRAKHKQTLSAWAQPLASVWQCFSQCWATMPHVTELNDSVGGILENFVGSDSDFTELFTATEALSEFLNELTTVSVPHDQSELYKEQDVPSLDVVGWLELLHDSAHGVLLLGLNEGILPEARVHDPFLPDGLKEQLSRRSPHARWTSDHRFARDVYLFCSLVASKQTCHVSFSAKGESGDLLMPGRLLYRCDDSELNDRLHHLQTVAPRWTHGSRLSSQSELTHWCIPPELPGKGIALEKISVTDFGIFIQSPYRYYLRRILHLGRVTDLGEELDPSSFGSLVHKVLERYGWSDSLQRLRDPDELSHELLCILDELILKSFPVAMLPALQVQFEVIRARLRSFTKAQVAWQSNGWEQCNDQNRLHPEFSLQRELVVDGIPILIQGRIDRIDRNIESKLFALLDYKTGDNTANVEKSHRSRTGKEHDGWLSLQMPLYQWMATEHPLFRGKEIITGYISLSKDNSYEIEGLKDWSTELESALNCAANIVRQIRSGCFQATPRDQDIYDDFALLCGYGQQGTLVQSSRIDTDTQFT